MEITPQASFNAGEWSPALFARVDLQKYRSGAALLENFFVDYRGGASSRAGTRYIIQCFKSATAVRLISFQATFSQGYVLEFGDGYIRFIFQGSPVLENGFAIAGASRANPAVITVGAEVAQAATPIDVGVSASYAPGDTVTLAGGTFTSPAVIGVTDTQLLSAAVNNPGSTVVGGSYLGYAAGDVLTLAGGTASPQAKLTVNTTKVIAAVFANFAPGTGGTPGAATVTGTTGTGTKFQASVTIGAGGGITAVNSITLAGSYTVNPTFVGSPFFAYVEPVTGGGLTGAKLVIQMGVGTFSITTPGLYTANPAGLAFTQASTTGNGTGATFNSAVFGPLDVSIISGGAYSIAPTNPVAQGSTSGGGVGVAFNVNFFGGANYAPGDWVFIHGVGGMTQLNGRYFSVLAVVGATITLGTLNGANLDSTGYTAYISGGTIQRIYTLASPYSAADLPLIKFAQVVDQMILCHPNHPVYQLTLISATNWTLLTTSFLTPISAPIGLTAAADTGGSGSNYAYIVTAVDGNGNESLASIPVQINNGGNISLTPITHQITWNPVTGAAFYNVYASDVSFFGVIPAGVQYGFIGNATGTTFLNSNIAPDFSQSPPIGANPFSGSPIASITQGATGTYTVFPTVSLSGGSPSAPAIANAVLGAIGTPTIGAGGSGYATGDTITLAFGIIVKVLTLSGSAVATFAAMGTSGTNAGANTSGAIPTNPLAQVSTSGSGTGATVNLTWGVVSTTVSYSGAGYQSVPGVIYSPAGATAIAVLGSTTTINPSVPAFFQQRLVLAAPLDAPQSFFMSTTGSYFNFNYHNPVEADDAITETLVSNTLNSIKSIVSATTGMLILSDKGSWLVNGGSAGSAVTPSAIVANAQSYIGASDVPPIVANYDVLYVQSKGSAVRDLAFNIYFNVFTGTDISITSSHLFYGFTVKEWAWAEQPFYNVWAVRNDGVMLTLTFLKEQDFVGWAHQTTAGNFMSVCVVTEPTATAGNVDAVYTVVQREVEGVAVQYIERVAERIFPNGLIDAWMVDCGLQYTGAATLNFQGAEQLAGLTVTGLAEDDQGNVAAITPFVMPASGFFSLPAPPAPATGYVIATIGLPYTYDLQTLAIDMNGPSIQGKVKKIPHVDVRINDTLNLSIGSNFNNLVPMKDTIQGNVSSALTGQSAAQIVVGLYSGDALTFLDPGYTVPGQYCIRGQSPYPASILGVFPTIVVGDD